MRSSGGTKSLLDASVVARMKSRIACFAGPSFHEASGAADWASAGVQAARSPGSAGKPASAPSTKRRLRPLELEVDTIDLLLDKAGQGASVSALSSFRAVPKLPS